MHPWNPSQWTEQYLHSLLGQPESSRLEFKSGKALAKKEDKDTFITKQLSPAVSAFANSEGGIIVIGMDEDRNTKKKPRVAAQLDGIVIGPGNAIESPEQFDQILGTCISPWLPGLAVQRVPLSSHPEGRLTLVVHVPQGTTAYQARDHRYYSRSEFETKPMPDHEVRLRMQRGRTPQARLELGSRQRITTDQEIQRHLKNKAEWNAGFFPRRRTEPSREELAELAVPRRGFDRYEFNFAVVNTGELTIRDFVLVVRVVNHDERLVFLDERNRKIGAETNGMDFSHNY